MKRNQLHILLLGILGLLIGFLCGIPYGISITRGWGEDAVRAWRTAHLGLVLGGILLIAVAGVFHLLILNSKMASACAWSLAISVYATTVGVVIAAVSGARGLEPIGPFINFFVFFANVAGALGALIGVTLMAVGTIAALRNSSLS